MAGTVAVAVFGALWLSEPPPEPIARGQPAPAFELPRLDGGTEVSLAGLRGRIVLLNFWATWCKPCEEEMPAMQRLYARLHGEGFELLAVSVDIGREEVVAFRERLGLTFPILLDPQRKVSHAYQSYRYPESYLIDREGKIQARYVGPRDWDAEVYGERIARLVAAQGGAEPEPVP